MKRFDALLVGFMIIPGVAVAPPTTCFRERTPDCVAAGSECQGLELCELGWLGGFSSGVDGTIFVRTAECKSYALSAIGPCGAVPPGWDSDDSSCSTGDTTCCFGDPATATTTSAGYNIVDLSNQSACTRQVSPPAGGV